MQSCSTDCAIRINKTLLHRLFTVHLRVSNIKELDRELYRDCLCFSFMPSKVQGQCQATLDVPWPKLDRAPSVRCRGSGSVHIGTARTTNAIRLPLQLPTKLQRCHTLSGSSSGLLLVARNSSGTAKSSLRND